MALMDGPFNAQPQRRYAGLFSAPMAPTASAAPPVNPGAGTTGVPAPPTVFGGGRGPAPGMEPPRPAPRPQPMMPMPGGPPAAPGAPLRPGAPPVAPTGGPTMMLNPPAQPAAPMAMAPGGMMPGGQMQPFLDELLGNPSRPMPMGGGMSPVRKFM